MATIAALIAGLLVVGCGADGSDADTGAGSDSSGAAADGSSEAGSSGGAEESGSSGGDTGSSAPTLLPTPTGTCPDLAAGDVMFSPAGTDPRMVRLWMSDAAKSMSGPLVFYWHGTGSAPDEALIGLNEQFVNEVVAQGGVVVSPHADPAAGQFPWFLTSGLQEFDLLVADEVLACALEQLQIDTTRIHSIGMSAGGLHTSQMSLRRSGYLASVVTYSGGLILGTEDQDPTNKLAAMIFHGGASDVVVISFQDASEAYLEELRAAGRFGFICNHGNGHTIPPAQASVWQFFADHPWGTDPSPYADALPDSFPDYCAL